MKLNPVCGVNAVSQGHNLSFWAVGGSNQAVGEGGWVYDPRVIPSYLPFGPDAIEECMGLGESDATLDAMIRNFLAIKK